MMETIKIEGKTFYDVPTIKLPTLTADRAEFVAKSNLLKEGALRYDAELVQSFTGDSYLVADKGVTLPSYSTSAQTILAVSNLSPTVAMDFTNYDYFVVEKLVTIPEYETASKAKGRQEYACEAAFFEVVAIPANTVHALVDPSKHVTSRNVGISTKTYVRDLYWSSTSAVALYTATSYGVQQVAAAPTVSGTTLTLRAPSVTIRGNTTYFTSTFYNALTDVRLKHQIDVYRAPKNNLNLDGWDASQVMNSMIENI